MKVYEVYAGGIYHHHRKRHFEKLSCLKFIGGICATWLIHLENDDIPRRGSLARGPIVLP